VRNSSLIKRSCAENVTGLKRITEAANAAGLRFHKNFEDIFIATRQGWRQNFQDKAFVKYKTGGLVEER